MSLPSNIGLAASPGYMGESLKFYHEIQEALEKNQFFLVYQPQFSLSTGKIVGVEVLVRWKNSQGQVISPDRFIPFTEQSTQINALGEWIMRTAFRQYRAWENNGVTGLKLSVNISAVQLENPILYVQLSRLLRTTGMSPKNLNLELTETASIQDFPKVCQVISLIRSTGITLALDDFGTGYSGLSYLQAIEMDFIKIDRSFIRDLGANPQSTKILEWILSLSQNLNLQVIAEGVEHEHQSRILRQLGCHFVQGYYYSRPLSADDFYSFYKNYLYKDGKA